MRSSIVLSALHVIVAVACLPLPTVADGGVRATQGQNATATPAASPVGTTSGKEDDDGEAVSVARQANAIATASFLCGVILSALGAAFGEWRRRKEMESAADETATQRRRADDTLVQMRELAAAARRGVVASEATSAATCGMLEDARHHTATARGMLEEGRRQTTAVVAGLSRGVRTEWKTGCPSLLVNLLWEPHRVDGKLVYVPPVVHAQTGGRITDPIPADEVDLVTALAPERRENQYTQLDNATRVAVEQFCLWLGEVDDTYVAKGLLSWDSDLPCVKATLEGGNWQWSPTVFVEGIPGSVVLAHIAQVHRRDTTPGILAAIGVASDETIAQAAAYADKLWPVAAGVGAGAGAGARVRSESGDDDVSDDDDDEDEGEDEGEGGRRKCARARVSSTGKIRGRAASRGIAIIPACVLILAPRCPPADGS